LYIRELRDKLRNLRSREPPLVAAGGPVEAMETDMLAATDGIKTIKTR